MSISNSECYGKGSGKSSARVLLNPYEQRQVAHQDMDNISPCSSGPKEPNAEKAPAWNVDVGQWPGIDCMSQ